MIVRLITGLLCICSWSNSGSSNDSVRAEQRSEALRIADAINQRMAQVDSLYVRYDNEISFLADEMAVRKYLRIDFYPITRYCTFAFKENKRFYSFRGPDTVALLLPEVEPDWTAMGLPRPASPQSVVSQLPVFMSEQEFRARHPKLAKQHQRDGDGIPMTTIQSHGAFFYDGQWLREVREDESEAEVIDIANFQSDHSFFLRDYFYATATVIADSFSKTHNTAPQLEFVIDPEDQPVLAEPEEIDGVSCTVIDTNRGRRRFWLDQELGYAVRKHVQFFPDTKIPQAIWQNDQFREMLPGLWLPWHITYDRCGPPGAQAEFRGAALQRHEYSIDELTVNQDVEVMQSIRFEPGILVFDDRYKLDAGDGKTMTLGYIMPAEESEIDAAAKRMIARIETGQRTARLHRLAKQLLIVGLAAVALGSLWFRKKSTPVAG